MLQLHKNRKNKQFYMVFILCMSFIIGLFAKRVDSGELVTPLSYNEKVIYKTEYQSGNIYDRNLEEIMTTKNGKQDFYSVGTKAAFSSIIDEDDKNSPYTVLGNAPWLYGFDEQGVENRLTIEGFLHPAAKRVGGDISLTIDRNLQEYIDQCVRKSGYQQAYVIVSNYHTGEMLAVYGKVFETLLHPGSTMKPILAASALQIDGKYAEHVYDCSEANHYFQTAGDTYRINCAGNTFHGSMNMSNAMAYSCNGYFISLLKACDQGALLSELKKWGFDTVINYQQFGYADHQFIGNSSEEIDYLLAAIGQSNAKITPAGLHFCTSALLNHGKLVEPTWILQKKESKKTNLETSADTININQICDDEVADQVIQMMQAVTMKGTGSAFVLPDFAAKTGTAQKSDASGENNGLYTVWTTGGFVSDEKPISITVCLDNVTEKTTSTDAGKLAKEILCYMQEGD